MERHGIPRAVRKPPHPMRPMFRFLILTCLVVHHSQALGARQWFVSAMSMFITLDFAVKSTVQLCSLWPALTTSCSCKRWNGWIFTSNRSLLASKSVKNRSKGWKNRKFVPRFFELQKGVKATRFCTSTHLLEAIFNRRVSWSGFWFKNLWLVSTVVFVL